MLQVLAPKLKTIFQCDTIKIKNKIFYIFILIPVNHLENRSFSYYRISEGK